MATGSETDTRVQGSAHQALASACAEVRAAGPDDAVDGIAPGLVARPGDVDQVAELLRAAAAHDLSVVPRGRGTKLTWGAPPRSVDVVLDLSGLDRVLDHAAGDLILAAQAGTTLAEVQRVAAEGDQRLTLDETVPGGSVGGVLATNASGPRRTSVGAARDLLIGVTMVRADGVVAKAGGRVVKNVAGYDLGKLLIGSFGTLGVIVDATFRLHPDPPAHRWVSVPLSDPAAALAAAQEAVHSHVVPAAVEVEWPAGGSDDPGGSGGSGGVVHVLLEGRPDGVAGRAERLRDLLGGGSPGGPAATESEDPPAGRATYPWDPAARGDERAVALKLTHRLSGLAAVLTVAREVGAHVRGSAGSGVLYAALPPGTDPATAEASVARLRTVCTAEGGAAVVVDGPAAVKAAVDVWGPVPALDLMRRVKDQFDPDHRLSPGRFAGGI